MSDIVVVHELSSGPTEAWYPHLAAELTESGHRVRIPQLPDPDAPRPAPWLQAISTEIADPADTVLVGHSLGGDAVLRLLQEHDLDEQDSFSGALLVATPAREVGYEQLAPFFDGGFDWQHIRDAAREFRILTAIDDPVLTPDPLEHVQLLIENLGATAVITSNGVHFSRQQDRRELMPAIALVKELLP